MRPSPVLTGSQPVAPGVAGGLAASTLVAGPSRTGNGAAVLPWPSGQALRRRSHCLDEASASPARPVPRRASSAAVTSTTRASSRCSPAPCARSRPPCSAGRSGRRCGPSSRSSPCWSARSAPGSRPTPRSTEAHRAEQLKRLDGVATILAKTAARDTSLLALLAEDAVVSDAARALRARDARGRRRRGGRPRRSPRREPTAAAVGRRRAASCRSRSSPGSWPTRSWPPTSPAAAPAGPRPRRLAGWELLGPLLPLLRVRRRRRLGLHAAARAAPLPRRAAGS